MFETFLHNSTGCGQKVDGHVLHKFENIGHDFNLLFAYKRLWPFQQIDFEAIVATPKDLCCLEKTLLYIYQLMPDAPPDSKTITEELALGNTCFVDEITAVLVELGALRADSDGRRVITDLGCECYSRGQIPSKTRKQRLSLCFDPVGHDFPRTLFFTDDDQSCSEGNDCQPIVPTLHRANPNRINLDTIRCVAASQGLLPSDDAVVFNAEPVDGEAEAAMVWREVYVLVFLNDQRQISVRLHDPKSKTATEWFQHVIENHLKGGYISLSGLLSPLAVPGGTDTNGDGDSAGWSRISAHQVQDKILSAINNANECLSIQTRGFGDNGNGDIDRLFEAIKNAAERGVRCSLLWAGIKINGNNLIHENISHCSTPTIDRELLIIDDSIVLATLISQVTLPSGESVGCILTVGESESSLVCHKLKQRFIETWQTGKSPDSRGAATGLQNNSSQIAKMVTASAVQKESEV